MLPFSFRQFIKLTFVSMLGLAACQTARPTDDCIDETKINPDAVCIQIYQPVCGCDGNTYSNDCIARNNGVLRWTEGECSDTGQN